MGAAVLFSNGPKKRGGVHMKSSISPGIGQCNDQSRVLARKAGYLGSCNLAMTLT